MSAEILWQGPRPFTKPAPLCRVVAIDGFYVFAEEQNTDAMGDPRWDRVQDCEDILKQAILELSAKEPSR